MANIKFAEIAEIFFSNHTITKENGFVRVPEPEKLVKPPTVIPEKKDEPEAIIAH